MRLQWISAGLLLWMTIIQGQEAHAHAEHATGEPVPQVLTPTHLPRGVDLVIVKTTAHQFSLSSDGRQQIDVLADDGQAFIRIHNGAVLANLNSPYWFRSMQPGGGLVPSRLKDGEQFLKLKPDWKVIAQQSGFGWYDARLVDENMKSFKLTLQINGAKHVVQVQRKSSAGFTGYWTSRLTREPDGIDVSALIPGLSTGAIALSRSPASKSSHEVLDATGKPFIRCSPNGWWVDVSHPWFKDLGLYVNTQNPETHKAWGTQWVKSSDSLMLTYQDPRLRPPTEKSRSTRQWHIPVREMTSDATHVFSGDMQWRDATEKPPRPQP